MLIFDILKKDHDAIKHVLTALSALNPSDVKWHSTLILQLRELVIPHSRAEEDVFYDAIHLNDKAKNVALHGYQEHLTIEYILRNLILQDKIDYDWSSTVKELKAVIENHLSEEENAIFPIAEILFSEDELRLMGKDFLRLKNEFLQELRGDSRPDHFKSQNAHLRTIS